MIVDRHTPADLFSLVPQSLLGFEPELAQLDALLDDDQLFQAVRSDLASRAPQSRTRGRPGTPVEVVLRMLVLKRLYGWSYAETERFVSDSLVLRQFCRVYLERAPDDTTLIRWAGCVGASTLERLNERAVELARQHKVTRGRKLRIDSTVVETDVHHPTDSSLLRDGVRVLSRLLRRAKRALGEEAAQAAALPKQVFRTRMPSVRRAVQQIHRTARRRGEGAAEELHRAYEKLIGVAEATQAQAERVAAVLKECTEEEIEHLTRGFDRFLPLMKRAISQARRRVLEGGTVPSPEKLLSLFEPHTQTLVRHKAGKPVEFGRKLILDEAEGGIVTRYEVLPEPGPDHLHLAKSLATHQERFGRAPDLLAGDRGLYSAENEQAARDAGVRHVVLPKTGRITAERQAYERQRWFRRGFRFRAGAEGRISVLQRKYGLNRCLYHGEAGMQRWVGWAVLTSNLSKIASTVAARGARRTCGPA
ncbi:MAG TPA: ISNCY family transposase [Longimicrobiaceae bacterium]|nr:ISNCY family transposase [Longimicrobiaceae bacterium]